MDEYVCLTVRSLPGESESAFSARLSRFWTHVLRTWPDDFEKVYAETTAFSVDGPHATRTYLVEDAVVELLERELAAAGIAHGPIDRDDLYSRYEATPPDWMQIEH